MVDGGIEEQAKQVFKNLVAIAKTAGSNLQHTIKCTVFLTDMRDFKMVNEICESNFTSPIPARSAFQAAPLPSAGTIEMKAVINIKTMSLRTSKEDQ